MNPVKLALLALAPLTCIACAMFLMRHYTRTRARIVLWSAVCFVCLAVNNILLFIDLVVIPTGVDLRIARHATALTGMLFLLYGFIWERDG